MCDIALEYDINFTPLLCELINFRNNNLDIVNNFDRVSFYAESKSLAWVILFEECTYDMSLYACESFRYLPISTSPKVISLLYQKCTIIYFTIIFNDATILCNAISQTLNTRLF